MERKFRIVVLGQTNSGTSLVAALLEVLLKRAGADATYIDPEMTAGAREARLMVAAGVAPEHMPEGEQAMLKSLFEFNKRLLAEAKIVVEPGQMMRDGAMVKKHMIDADLVSALVGHKHTIRALNTATEQEYEPEFVDEVPGIKEFLLDLNTLFHAAERSNTDESELRLGLIKDAFRRMASNRDPEYVARQQAKIKEHFVELCRLYDTDPEAVMQLTTGKPGPYSGTGS